MRRAASLGLLFTGVVLCSAFAVALSKEDEAARESAMQWLEVVDSGNYKDAALMISEAVRASRDWSNYLAGRRAALGRVNKRRSVEVKHASTFPGAADVRNYDIIRFRTSFERKAITVEEDVVTKMGCCWEIFG